MWPRICRGKRGRALALRWALAVGLAALTGGVAAETSALQIATGELPPYATQSRPDQGIALAIVRRAFELSGHKVEFHFRPWPRAQQETQQGQWDASAYWGASPARQRSFLLSDNVLTEQWVIIYRRELKLDWQELRQLRPYTLGVIREYTYTPEFWALLKSGELRSDSTPSDEAGLRKLLLGRIDAMPMERNVACDLLYRHFTPEQASRLQAHPRLLTESFTTHLILPLQAPRSAALLADFNQGLKKLKASGEYQTMLSKVQCPSSWLSG